MRILRFIFVVILLFVVGMFLLLVLLDGNMPSNNIIIALGVFAVVFGILCILPDGIDERDIE